VCVGGDAEGLKAAVKAVKEFNSQKDQGRSFLEERPNLPTGGNDRAGSSRQHVWHPVRDKASALPVSPLPRRSYAIPGGFPGILPCPRSGRESGLEACRPVRPAYNVIVYMSFDLWELTTCRRRCSRRLLAARAGAVGRAGRHLAAAGHQVTPLRAPDSRASSTSTSSGAAARGALAARARHRLPLPDPRAPYTAGLSPLRACFEQAQLLSDLTSFAARSSKPRHPRRPGRPDQVIGEEERDRLQTQWNQRFQRGGAGRVVVAESAMRVQLLQHSMGDLAPGRPAATREDIANAFHIPLAFLTSETNLANLQAAQESTPARRCCRGCAAATRSSTNSSCRCTTRAAGCSWRATTRCRPTARRTSANASWR